MYQSILSLIPGEFFKGRIPHPPGQKKVRNPDLCDREIVLRHHPQGNYFQKSSKIAKHEIEIMKNNNEMLICLEILKQ